MTPIAIIRIDRPHVRNAIDSATAQRLHDEIAAFEADPATKIAILYGDEQAFCSGADLNRLPDLRDDGPLGPTRRTIAKPVIAAIEGWCVGGGLELAAMCDLRVASDTARFGFFDRRQGVPLVDGGTVRLPRIVGLGRALDLILTGREFDVTEAHSIGLVNRVVPAGTALHAAVELAEQIADYPWNCVLSDRASTYAAYELPSTTAFAHEQHHGENTIFTADFAKRVISRTLRAAAKKTKAALPF